MRVKKNAYSFVPEQGQIERSVGEAVYHELRLTHPNQRTLEGLSERLDKVASMLQGVVSSMPEDQQRMVAEQCLPAWTVLETTSCTQQGRT